MLISIESKDNLWLTSIQDHLSRPLLEQSGQSHCDITFVCFNNEKVAWNGFAYLASLSGLFRPRSEEEPSCTMMLPDFPADVVRKFLLLLSTGSVDITELEAGQITQLTTALGVSTHFIIIPIAIVLLSLIIFF